MDTALEVRLEVLFSDNKDALNLARICIRQLSQYDMIDEEELMNSVLGEGLNEEGYSMGGSDYREREEELVHLYNTILDSLIDGQVILQTYEDDKVFLSLGKGCDLDSTYS